MEVVRAYDNSDAVISPAVGQNTPREKRSIAVVARGFFPVTLTVDLFSDHYEFVGGQVSTHITCQARLSQGASFTLEKIGNPS